MTAPVSAACLIIGVVCVVIAALALLKVQP